MIYFAKIPDEMKKSISWLAWHKLFDKNTGKYKKRPNQFRKETPDQHVGWDVLKLQTFQEAKAEYKDRASMSDGIGFVFTPTSVWAGIDIDNAILKDGSYNMPVRELVKPILAQAIKDKCYIEKSISGTGYHIFGYTKLKPALKAVASAYVKGNNTEIHFENTYFTVSGDRLNDGWGCLDNTIRIAYQIIKGEPLPETTHENTPTKATNTTTGINIPPAKENAVEHAKTATKDIPAGEFTDADVLALPGLTVASVLELMSKDTRKNGGEISYAMQVGHPDGYNKSEYDERALGVLTYWLYRYGVDEIVKVFKTSALWTDERIKKKSDHYVEQAATKAYNNAEKFFPAVNYKRLTSEEKAKLNRWIRRKEKE